MEPYKIIYQQLGGSKFAAMVGAFNFFRVSEGSIQFRFKGCRRFNYCRITLNQFDLYDIVFARIDNAPDFTLTSVRGFENVYAEDLQRIFTEVTGLDTHL